MSDPLISPTSPEAEENEPVFYNPKTIALISNIMEWVAWIILAGFIGNLIMNIWLLNVQAQGQSIADLFSQAGAQVVLPFLYQNFLTPLFTGLTYFLVLLGVAKGLNVLREIEFNQRESK